MRYYSSTARDTTLTAFISNSATEIQVAGTDGFPQTPFVLVIDPDSLNEEIIDVTNVSGNTLTVTRGVDGSSGLSHNIGAVCRHSVSGRDFTEAMNHRNNQQSVHGITGHVVGTTDEQTLTNKTLDAPVIKNPILEGLPDGGGPGVPGDIDIEADVDMNTFRVTNMGDAVGDQDAVTKSQLAAQIDLVNGATVDAGETTTVENGTPASVTNVGTQNAAIFDFVIPAGPQGVEGPEGPQGDGIQIKGTVDSSANLPGSANDGDIYIAADTGHGWAWDSETNQWIDLGELRGPQGEPGPPGDLPTASAADLVLTSTGTGDGDYEWAESSGGIDLTSAREHQLIQGDGSDGWAAGMAVSVVDEVPSDSDGDVGDVVFVTQPGALSEGEAAPAPGLVHIATASFDGQNEAVMDGVFTSDYDNYRIIFDSRQGGTFDSTVQVWMELRSGGVIVANGKYGTSLIYSQTGGPPATSYQANQSMMRISNIGNGVAYATFDLFRPAIDLTTHLSGTYGGFGDGGDFVGTVNSWIYDPVAGDGFRIWPESGQFTTCNISVYGYSKGA